MSISVLARRHGVNGHTFRKQYKEVISGYRSWSQGSHAESYILYPENLGPDLSLDETSLSNGEVYTVLTNKSAHGRNGSLVAMVRGVATDTVSQVLMRLPHEKRSGVSTVTTDLSSAMMLTARRAFPRAMIVNDRFHVQQLMSEAVDQLRVRLRWQVLEEENRSMREHRERPTGRRCPRSWPEAGTSYSSTSQSGTRSRGNGRRYSSAGSPSSDRHTD